MDRCFWTLEVTSLRLCDWRCPHVDWFTEVSHHTRDAPLMIWHEIRDASTWSTETVPRIASTDVGALLSTSSSVLWYYDPTTLVIPHHGFSNCNLHSSCMRIVVGSLADVREPIIIVRNYCLYRSVTDPRDPRVERPGEIPSFNCN